jgi:hypothetical protein
MIGLPVVEGTNPASCFPRAVIGSEATCYSRLWSEVYAADIFASKFGDGHPNLYAGLQFRDKVRSVFVCLSFDLVVCECKRTKQVTTTFLLGVGPRRRQRTNGTSHQFSWKGTINTSFHR